MFNFLVAIGNEGLNGEVGKLLIENIDSWRLYNTQQQIINAIYIKENIINSKSLHQCYQRNVLGYIMPSESTFYQRNTRKVTLT